MQNLESWNDFLIGISFYCGQRQYYVNFTFILQTKFRHLLYVMTSIKDLDYVISNQSHILMAEK